MSESPIAMLHGPGGLLSTPGLGSRHRRTRKWGARLKDKQIVGNLYRSDTGKFTAGNGPSNPDAPVVAVMPKRPRKGKRAPKARQTPAQRAQARSQQRQTNIDDVAKRMAATDTGLGPSGSRALSAFAQGQQPDKAIGDAFVKGGLAEQGADGAYRMTPTGRAVIGAMAAGDYQRAIDGLSRASDTVGKRTERQGAATQRRADTAKRQQDAAGKRVTAQAGRELARRQRAEQAKKPGGGSKKPAQEAAQKPLKVNPKRLARSSAPSAPAGGSSSPSKPKPAEAKPSKEQAVASNRGAVRQAMADADAGLAPGGFDNLIALGSGKEPDERGATGLISMGMAERGSDGTLRLTSGGRQAIAAADRGDAKAAIDAISRASEPKLRTKAQTPQDKAMFANMGGGGGGGGGSGGGKPSGGVGGLYPKGPSGKRTPQAAAAQSGGGGGAKPATGKGDAKPKKDDKKPVMSGGDKPTSHVSSRDRAAIEEGSRPIAQRITNAENKFLDTVQGKGFNEAESHKILDYYRKNKILKIDSTMGQYSLAHGDFLNADVMRRVFDQPADKPKAKKKEAPASFTVFKDHTGQQRWIARTTTAYRDRDNEIISEAALDQDSQRMMATKQFGPLRYWHIGQPDPFDQERPWGPGVDIGDCDYSVVIGRTRIESGTFHDPVIAQKVARQAEQYELSPGFFHPLDQPGADGVFNAVRSFERSIVPIKYGRASNLFTGLAVKEQRMDTDEMEKRFKTAISDLGLDAQQAASLGQQLVATEKAATAQGIAFKDADAPEEYPDVVINGITYKAFPPKVDNEPVAVEEQADDPMAEMVDEVVVDEEPAGDYVGDMSVADHEAMLKRVVLDPLIKALDITGQMNEFKSLIGGTATKDDARSAELAALKSSVAEALAKIAQIEGDQPATILPDEVAAALKSDGPTQAAEPEHAAITHAINDPTRPFAGWGIQTFPELYQNGENT